MKGWENNVLLFEEEKCVGVCPNCGSSDIQIEEYQRGDRKSLSFLCRSCGSGDHFDGFIKEEVL